MYVYRSLLMSARNRNYDPMSEDGYDSKIPLHNDEAFQHGIYFNAKFIGSLEVPKPASRVEIVTAMRRIRYEFKAKAVKKRKINLSISVDGIKVCLLKSAKKDALLDESKYVVMQYPIYRVFYVSHDSQDLKIFSFIARDNTNNSFRCNVFKAYKKNEAMRIVRTIGQAFEVCHKLSIEHKQQTVSPISKTNEKSRSSPIETVSSSPELEQTSENQENILAKQPSAEPVELIEKTERYLQSVQAIPPPPPTEFKPINLFSSSTSSEFTLKHQMQFMQEQLQQMQNESELAFNQIKLVKEQLNIEIAARIDAQNKNTQLLQRNRELLIHIQQLLIYTNDLELKLANQDLSKACPSRPTDLSLFPSLFSTLTSPNTHQCPSSDSPDSGKGKEISSESISDPFMSNFGEQPMNNSLTEDLTTHSISQQQISAYNSTSPSLTSSSRSSTHSIKPNSIQQQINSTSFTNSAFSQSPLRTVTKEFDPYTE